MDEDNADLEEPYHPPFVVKALDWAEGLTDAELLAASRIRDSGASGYLPPAALVRLIRRYRVEGAEELSNRLTLPLIQHAYDYVSRMFAKLGVIDAQDVAQETIKDFLTELAEQDGVDWWEVTFHRELRRRGSKAYRHLFKRHRQRTVEYAAHYETNDAGEAASATMLHATLTAFAETHFASAEKRILFVLLMKGELPIAAPEAPNDLVRLTGKSRSTLANLKTEFKRLLVAALAENAP